MISYRRRESFFGFDGINGLCFRIEKKGLLGCSSSWFDSYAIVCLLLLRMQITQWGSFLKRGIPHFSYFLFFLLRVCSLSQSGDEIVELKSHIIGILKSQKPRQKGQTPLSDFILPILSSVCEYIFIPSDLVRVMK
jgi:hypothetical protein